MNQPNAEDNSDHTAYQQLIHVTPWCPESDQRSGPIIPAYRNLKTALSILRFLGGLITVVSVVLFAISITAIRTSGPSRVLTLMLYSIGVGCGGLLFVGVSEAAECLRHIAINSWKPYGKPRVE